MLARKSKGEHTGRTVVISDMHFGDETQLLDDRRLVDRLMEALATGEPIDELILLGDVLDLWVKTTVPALRQARYFIESLTRLPDVKRIIYIPGNHDHQMFLDAFRLEMDVQIMQGDLSIPKFTPARSYGETLISALGNPKSRVPFSMVYPFLVRRVHDKEVLYSHGHHLDFFATEFGWARTFWLGRHIIKARRKNATLHDIEMANIPFCGAMSVWPWVPELVDEGLRYYHVISFFAKLFRSKNLQQSPLRDSLIKQNYDEISGLLPLFEHPHPDCFIFGHTHRPGAGRIPESGILVANSGAWTRGDDETIPSRTWIEVGDHVKLFALSREGADLLMEESI